MAEVKHTLRVEGGANSHFFDGCLLDQDGKCLAFVGLDHPLTPVIAAAPDLFEAGTELQAARKAQKLAPSAENLSRVRAASDAFDTALSKATTQQEGS
ncbi:MAG: hypothetical protein IE912_03115 [Brevundimonas diminuta]|nr:hypothetical protein [Brevundimonas diminuta]MBD3817891.1 hypothetical protein [Brevundimonas diminuta]